MKRSSTFCSDIQNLDLVEHIRSFTNYEANRGPVCTQKEFVARQTSSDVLPHKRNAFRSISINILYYNFMFGQCSEKEYIFSRASISFCFSAFKQYEQERRTLTRVRRT